MTYEKEKIKKIVRDYNTKQSELKEEYLERGGIKGGVYLKIEFDYLSTNDVEFVFRKYKDSVIEVLRKNHEKNFPRLKSIPVEIISSETGNSIEFLLGIDPAMLVILNKHVLLELANANNIVNAIDWVGRYLIIEEVTRRFRQKLRNYRNRKNIKQLTLEEFD